QRDGGCPADGSERCADEERREGLARNRHGPHWDDELCERGRETRARDDEHDIADQRTRYEPVDDDGATGGGGRGGHAGRLFRRPPPVPLCRPDIVLRILLCSPSTISRSGSALEPSCPMSVSGSTRATRSGSSGAMAPERRP